MTARMKTLSPFHAFLILALFASTATARRIPQGAMGRVHTVESDAKPTGTVPVRSVVRAEERFNPYTREKEWVLVMPKTSKSAAGETSSGSTFEPHVHPSDKTLLQREVASLGESVETSLAKPISVKFSPEQFEKLAAELVKPLYVVDAPSGQLGLGVGFRSRNGIIGTTPRVFMRPTREPTSQQLVEAFAAGESFLLIRKVPMKTSCARCEGVGLEKTGQYRSADREPDVRYAQCTRCHGAKTVTVDVDLLHKIELKPE